MRAQSHVAIGLFVAGVLVGAAAPVHAQETRDPHAGTVAPGWFEVETGIERDRVSPGVSIVSTPTLLKFGVAPRGQFDVTLTTVRPSGRQSLGLGDAGVGVKWRLADDLPLLGVDGGDRRQPGVRRLPGSLGWAPDRTDLGDPSLVRRRSRAHRRRGRPTAAGALRGVDLERGAAPME